MFRRFAPVLAAVLIAGPARPARAGATADTAATPDSGAARVQRTLGVGARRPLDAADALADSLRQHVPLAPRPAVAPPPAPPAAVPLGPAIPESLPYYWRTRAELTLWRQTASYDETMRYCRQLEAGSRWIKLVSYGTSEQGRDLPMLIVSRDRAFTPEAARATGKPVVLIQNGIHAGEIEGKDASLALVRDMAVLHTRESLLDSCTVLVIPIYSVDAHERSGPWNRINQNGPAEMGWRTTPVGLNLNRDYVKAEAPETRAWISGVYTRWWPELLVDDHTTDGADYQHDVTYAFNHGPTAPAPLTRWFVDAFEGRVVPRLAAMGHLPAPYLSFRRGNDPRSGIEFGDQPPRFSTGYGPMQGRAALLVETHMLKPYGDRVRATYDLLVALLEEIHARPRALVNAVRESGRAVSGRAGARDLAGREVALASVPTDHAESFPFRGRRILWEQSPVTGAAVARFLPTPWDTILPLYREMAATTTATEPAGYLVPREWSAAIDLLRLHGVHVRRLARAWRDTVEVERILEWHADPAPREGHHGVQVSRMALERREHAFRAGDVWVPLDQDGALVAVNLCEAQAPDGFMAWNFFDTVLERKEYAEDYVIEPIARDTLAKDPALAKEFAARLAADSTFARDPRARADFFYRRSRWADPEQNLLPVLRALHAVPESVLEPPPSPIDSPPPATPRH